MKMISHEMVQNIMKAKDEIRSIANNISDDGSNYELGVINNLADKIVNLAETILVMAEAIYQHQKPESYNVSHPKV